MGDISNCRVQPCGTMDKNEHGTLSMAYTAVTNKETAGKAVDHGMDEGEPEVIMSDGNSRSPSPEVVVIEKSKKTCAQRKKKGPTP